MVPPHGIQQCSFAYSLFQGISSSMPGNSRGRGRGKSSFSFYTIIVYKLEKVAQRDCPPKYYNWSLAWKWSIRKKMASWRKKGREGKKNQTFFGWEPGYYYMGMYYAKDNLFAPPAASLFAGGKMNKTGFEHNNLTFSCCINMLQLSLLLKRSTATARCKNSLCRHSIF